jgi:SAP domain-containing ribonucleoprotein
MFCSQVSELREALKAKGLNTTGNKQELVDRLSASLLDGSHIDSKFEDDLLNDVSPPFNRSESIYPHSCLRYSHFQDDLDNEEKSLLESTKDLLHTPESSKSTTPEQPMPAKKVTLKRNIIAVQPLLEEKTETEKKDDDDLDEPDKKVIKISAMTAKDRLEFRAKKFGASAAAAAAPATASTGNLPSQEKLEARAARFGITAPTTTASTTNASSITASSAPPDAELLKKRAERFGAISTVVKKVELNEKLQKRAERFGETPVSTTGKVAITGPSSAGDAKSDYAEKARLRLERFKQTA